MKILKPIEKIVLRSIGEGADTQKKLRFELQVTNRKVKLIKKTIKNLTNIGLIKLSNGKFILTEKGLLIASEASLTKDTKIIYKTNNNKPFFNYKNSLERDIIFLPYLSFDTIYNFAGENSYRLYRTKIDFLNLDISLLQVIENLLYDIPYENKGGFWILKNKKSFCGFEISNLFLAMKELNSPEFEIKVTFSGHFYVLILNGKVKNNKFKKLSLTLYLNNCGELPYIDGLNYLNKRLELFLKFVGINKIPLGKEVIIKNFSFKKFFKIPYRFTFFIPMLYGKLIFKGLQKNYGINQPLIIAINPKNINGVLFLKKVSPWFVCCNGGFLEEDFIKKREFQFHYVYSYDFPELTIVQIILSPYSKNFEEII